MFILANSSKYPASCFFYLFFLKIGHSIRTKNNNPGLTLTLLCKVFQNVFPAPTWDNDLYIINKECYKYVINTPSLVLCVYLSLLALYVFFWATFSLKYASSFIIDSYTFVYKIWSFRIIVLIKINL